MLFDIFLRTEEILGRGVDRRSSRFQKARRSRLPKSAGV